MFNIFKIKEINIVTEVSSSLILSLFKVSSFLESFPEFGLKKKKKEKKNILPDKGGIRLFLIMSKNKFQ